MGNNSAGFQNEDNIRDSMNNKRFDKLNENLKKFIKCIEPKVIDSDIIRCTKIAGQNKCDLKIILKEKSYRISVKKGFGNSVHQEPVQSFIKYLEKDFDIDNSLANDIRFFIWGDGTYDGTGSKKNRLDVTQLKKEHPDVIENLKEFFEEHKIDLIKRFLLTGVSEDQIDFIYYGNEEKGLWASKKEFLNVVADGSSNSRTAVPVGKLSFQAWNRAINGDKSENKRGVIQLKWASLKKDLESITNERGDI